MEEGARILMEVHGFARIFTDGGWRTEDGVWRNGDPGGRDVMDSGIFTDVHGLSWIFMDVHGFAWMFSDVHGCGPRAIDFH